MAYPKLTPEVQYVIVQAVRSGLPISLAASKCEIGQCTVRNWLKKGRAGEDPKLQRFAHAVDKARAEFAESMVGFVGKFAKTDVKAATWLLDRLYKEFRPAQESKLELEGKGQPVAQVVFVGAQKPKEED